MSYNPFSLSGKTILITGASSGIGRATAVECSKLGATCIITGRNKERLSETFESLEGNGHSMFIADLSKKDELKSLISNLPCINGLVNNAGISKPLPVNFVTGSNLVIDGGITVKI